MTSEELVFGSSNQFDVLALQMNENQVMLSVRSCKKYGLCPACNACSSKLHSYYFRKVKDLPAFGNRVDLHIRAKKWHCYNPHCVRQIFTERFDHFFKPYKRTSDRIREKLLKVSLLVGGKPGQKLSRMLNIDVELNPA